MLLLVPAQDEGTTVIALPKQDATPQFPDKTSVLSMKPPEALAVSPDYDPLYIFVSGRILVCYVPLLQQILYKKTEELIGNIFLSLEFQGLKTISSLKLLASIYCLENINVSVF